MINEHAPPRKFALDVVRQLRQAGYEALWAGGCVRDELLGKTPNDYDVATSAKPEQVREVFGHRRTIPIGAAFGVITVQGPPDAGMIEVATFRQDANYSDGRHPDGVTFTNAEEDAKRRDFTINGLFYDPVAQRVIDYVGGENDLRAGIVRAIGNPHERIDEDKLRMLRAVRFTATFGFELDVATSESIRRHAPSITIVSAERIAAEMRRMLVHKSRSQAVTLLDAAGLLRIIMPEADVLREGDESNLSPQSLSPQSLSPQSLSRLDKLRQPTFSLALAALLLSKATKKTIETIGERWKLSNEEVARAAWLTEHGEALDSATCMAWSQLQPLLIHRDSIELVELLAVRSANGECDAAAVTTCRAKLSLDAEQLNPVPLIDGDVLRGRKIPPGPIFRPLLQSVRDQQLDGQISTAEEALALVDRLLAERASDDVHPR